nr:taste receptor type 1 member 1-like [Monopterus albus]
MKHFLAFLSLLELHALAQHTVSASDFHLDGDYVIGGLIDIHHVSTPATNDRPESINCSSQPFLLRSYRSFQLMRFSVEEINNSTDLLPNVSLGYEIFDHCSETQNFPGILNLISVNGLVQPWSEPNMNLSRLIAVLISSRSTETMSVASIFMAYLIPVVSYGATESAISGKPTFSSFLQTVHPNAALIEVIFNIVQHFSWHWIAFLISDNDLGKNGLNLFKKRIKDTEICLGYTQKLNDKTIYSDVLQKIESQGTNIIIVFANEMTAEALIESAIKLNITDKVWIAGDTWSLDEKLRMKKGIENIGTVLGVSQPAVTINGFRDFIYTSKSHNHFDNAEQQKSCNQVCNCNGVSAEDILAVDSSVSFPIYSAVYAIAHALHKTLQCDLGKCNTNMTVYPYMVLKELRNTNFTLLNQSIQFDEDGNPLFGSYSVVFWNHSGGAQEIGFCNVHSSVDCFINGTEIQWYTEGNVPTSLCSEDCPIGYIRDKSDKCCFTCDICPNGTYVNETEDPYKCNNCKETEWSEEGSTSCSLRSVEYIPFTAMESVLIMVWTCVLVGLILAMAVLFAINYNTPVVRSAGGPMCFLILGCLNLCSVSVFFYFGKPTTSFCILRFFPFILFYTVCLACFVVRSFQIVCIFKMSNKFPQFYRWWMKYNGQWLVIAGAFVTQALFLLIGYSYAPPGPYNETLWYPNEIILSCDININETASSMILLSCLCSLCFIFSYMGKDLPKNYNEAKAITFCLLLLIITWIIFAAVYMLYRGKHIQTINALAVLSSLYSFLFWYFLPKCYIIIFQPHKNTQQYFQGLIQNYTKTISQ